MEEDGRLHTGTANGLKVETDNDQCQFKNTNLNNNVKLTT